MLSNMLKRITIILLITFIITGTTAEEAVAPDAQSAIDKYAYDITDNIPSEVQKEAYEYIVSSDAGVLGQKASRNNSYNKLLETYLQYYGIFAPIGQKNSIATWVQNELSASGKTHEIPEAYVSTEELTSWVDRYATPGDLLLYKTNGTADKCLIYAGDGKAIVKRDDVFKLLPFPSTYVTGDYKRTKSSGLFAIAHLWKNEDTGNACINLSITITPGALSFTGNQYRLLEYNTNTGKYDPVKDYIVFEKTPGCYVVWNGEGYGFANDYISEHSGIHIVLENAVSSERELPQRTKVDLSLEEIDMLGMDINISVTSQGKNQKLWYGKDLLPTVH